MPIRYSKLAGSPYAFSSGLSVYRLTPYFYAGIKGAGGVPSPANYHKIVSIESPYIYTGDGDSCIFAGNIFYRLESGRAFYYGVNGDVFKTGSVTISGGASVGIGESASISFGITYSNNYLKNIHFDGRYYNQNYYE